MRWTFWIAAALVVYAYAGYPTWLWLRKTWRRWPVQRGPAEPSISIVMVVRNEEAALPKKLQNLRELDYSRERLEIIVVSDGSTDGTERILHEVAHDEKFHALCNQLPSGKAAGLNDAFSIATGEVVVLTDVRQEIEKDALRLLMENFCDPQVGAASGELMLGDRANGETGRGMGLYWRVEKRVRELESASSSVVGATGAFYAVRRELLREIPVGTILDDVLIPMIVARQGSRVVFDSRARAWDRPDLGSQREFARKVRTLTGNYQLLQLAPWLLRKENPLRFEFVSHKLMRLVVPFALLAILLASCFVPTAFYRWALGLQLAFYGFGLLGWAGWKLGPLSRLADPACTFMVLNTAALVAFVNIFSGQKVEWNQPSLSKEIRA